MTRHIRRACVTAGLVLALGVRAQADITVLSGGDLQAALNTVVRGETITVEAGATFTGNFTLPAKTGSGVITVRTSASDAAFPTATYVDPATHGASMAIIRSNNDTPAILADSGDKNWTFIGIIFESGQTTAASGLDIVRLCDNTITSEANICDGFTVDRCAFRTSSSSHFAHRGLQFHGKNMVIKRSHFSGIRSSGNESHSLSTWNSPGPILIEDNYISAASIGFLAGGAVPGISGLINSDITFRRNYVTRDLAWQTVSGYAIKNLFELKNAQRVSITGNTFEHNWPDGQSGWAIVLTVRANGDGAGQSTIKNVTFEHNIVRKVAMGFNILGLDNQTSGCTGVCASTRMDAVTIRNNLIYQLDRGTWTGPTGAGAPTGALMVISGAPTNFIVEDNTAVGTTSGNILNLNGDAIPSLIWRRNITQKVITPDESYGVFGDAVGEGNAALNTYTTTPTFADNVLAGATASQYNSYTSGNTFPTVAALTADFTNPGAGNYRLIGGSAHIGKGVNQDTLEAAQVATVARPARLRLRLPG